MKTYVNTTLIDTHNAQMQLEQLEGVRLRRAGIFDVYGKFLMICAAGIATVMIGFGIMMWLMTPPVAPLGDEYITTYEISEVNIKGNASDISDSDIPGNGSPSISESLSEIQNNLEKVDKQTSESGVNPDVEDDVLDIDESVLPNDQFVVFRYHALSEGEGHVHTGLKYSANDFSQPFEQYCYWTEPVGAGELTTRLSLGDKTPGEAVIWSDHEMVKRYKQYCQFLPG